MATTHRTAAGKSIDMSALVSKNEKVRAISNVPMNAKGDIIDSNNNVISPVSQRVARTYNRATVNPTAQQNKNETLVASKTTPAQTKPEVPQVTPVPKKEEPPVVFLEDMSPDEIEYFDEFDAEEPQKIEVKPKKK